MKITGICDGLLLLAPLDCSGIVIKLFSKNGVIETEHVKFALIPWGGMCVG